MGIDWQALATSFLKDTATYINEDKDDARAYRDTLKEKADKNKKIVTARRAAAGNILGLTKTAEGLGASPGMIAAALSQGANGILKLATELQNIKTRLESEAKAWDPSIVQAMATMPKEFANTEMPQGGWSSTINRYVGLDSGEVGSSKAADQSWLATAMGRNARDAVRQDLDSEAYFSGMSTYDLSQLDSTPAYSTGEDPQGYIVWDTLNIYGIKESQGVLNQIASVVNLAQDSSQYKGMTNRITNLQAGTGADFDGLVAQFGKTWQAKNPRKNFMIARNEAKNALISQLEKQRVAMYSSSITPIIQRAINVYGVEEVLGGGMAESFDNLYGEGFSDQFRKKQVDTGVKPIDNIAAGVKPIDNIAAGGGSIDPQNDPLNAAWGEANVAPTLQRNLNDIIKGLDISDDIRGTVNVKSDPTQNIVTIATPDSNKSWDIQYYPSLISTDILSVTIHEQGQNGGDTKSRVFFDPPTIKGILTEGIAEVLSDLPPMAPFAFPTGEIDAVVNAIRAVGLNNTTGIGPRPKSSADNAEWNKINKDAGYIYDPETGDLNLRKLEKALQRKPEYKKLTPPQRRLYLDELVNKLSGAPSDVVPSNLDATVDLDATVPDTGGIARAETASTSLGSMPRGQDDPIFQDAPVLGGVGLGAKPELEFKVPVSPTQEFDTMLRPIVNELVRYRTDKAGGTTSLGRQKITDPSKRTMQLNNAIVRVLKSLEIEIPKNKKMRDELFTEIAAVYNSVVGEE